MRCRFGAHLWIISRHLVTGRAYFQRWAGWRNPHGHPIVIKTMCALPQTLRRDSHLPHGNFLRRGKVTSFPYNNSLRQALVRCLLPSIPQDMKWKWWCWNSANCINQKKNKLKGGYSATANLISQPWLKEIKVHMEDQSLTERGTIQLVKDFPAKCTCDKV